MGLVRFFQISLTFFQDMIYFVMQFLHLGIYDHFIFVVSVCPSGRTQHPCMADCLRRLYPKAFCGEGKYRPRQAQACNYK